MRYPGPSRQDGTLRFLMLAIAISFFGFGLKLTMDKNQQTTVFPSVQADTLEPNPTKTAAASVTLRLADGLTARPLVNQAIALITIDSCQGPCPSNSPLVLTTNQDGEIEVDQSLLQSQPLIYASGYKMAHYFTFADPGQPNILTIFNPVPDTKISYDISREVVPIGLELAAVPASPSSDPSPSPTTSPSPDPTVSPTASASPTSATPTP